MRRKFGWTAIGIVGMVFAPIGFVFLVVALAIRLSMNRLSGAFHVSGDPGILTAIFFGMGALFLVMGLLFLGYDLRRRRRMRRVFEEGYSVEAKILGPVEQRNVTVNGRHPWVLECAWTDPTGVVHVYHSRYLSMNVIQLLKADTVPVYIDRYDESIGFVDVDAVLPEIRVHG